MTGPLDGTVANASVPRHPSLYHALYGDFGLICRLSLVRGAEGVKRRFEMPGRHHRFVISFYFYCGVESVGAVGESSGMPSIEDGGNTEEDSSPNVGARCLERFVDL